MIKRSVALLLMIVLTFAPNIQLKAEILYNNEEEVLKTSEIDGIKWGIPYFMQEHLQIEGGRLRETSNSDRWYAILEKRGRWRICDIQNKRQ